MKIRSVGKGIIKARKTVKRERIESVQSPMFSGRMRYEKAYVSPKEEKKYYFSVSSKMLGGSDYAYTTSLEKAKEMVAKRKNVPVSSLKGSKTDDMLAKLVAIRE